MREIPKLTVEQQVAFDEILSFFESKDRSKKMHLLQGYAGTGKTFLSIRLVEHLVTTFSNRVLICAPTNKAVKVLKSEIKEFYLNINFSTIHSALGLKENIDSFGKITFVPDKSQKNKLNGYNMLIVDESSMLDDSLFYYILTETNNSKLKVLFIGDKAQIPPINKMDSIPFDERSQLKYSIGVSRLNTIIRQASGHPIIEFSDHVRKNLLSENVIPKNTRGKIESDKGNLFFYDHKNSEDEDRLIMLLDTLFCSKEFEQDASYAKVIAWTNQLVDNYNSIIRSMIFGESCSKIMEKEKLILDSPWVVNKKVAISTNEEVEVMSYVIRTLSIPGYPAMKYYDARVKFDSEGKDVFENIRILHEDSEGLYDKHSDLLLKAAKKQKQGSFEARNMWIKFYQFSEVFAHVKFAYAITAHKSQGSTYKNCIVIHHDINKNQKNEEKHRIFYTGITRASKDCYIIL